MTHTLKEESYTKQYSRKNSDLEYFEKNVPFEHSLLNLLK